MSGKGFVGLASAVVVSMALTGCQHRSGDRSFQTGPAYAQNPPPVPSSAMQNTNNYNMPGSGATAMQGQTSLPNQPWTPTPGMGTSGMNSMPAGRTMGMSTGSSLSGNSNPGYGMAQPAASNTGGASGSLIPPNPTPSGAGNVPVMTSNYDTLH